MDFIEKTFGIAPDGGSGTLELAIIFTTIAGILFLITVKKVFLKK